MGNASSILSSVVSKLVRGRDSALDYGYAHYLRNHSHGDTHNHDLVAGTAPIDLVLLGNRAQTLMPKIDALRSDPYPQAGTGATDSVRIVRRSPTADGMQETTVYSSALTCTILDVSLVQGELDAYRACLLHAMAFVFVVDLARYDEPDEEPTSLRSVMRDFERLCSGTWCTQGVPIILLFDNEDVFSKKFTFDSGAFGARFTDYMGEEDDAFAASQFILQRFMSMKTDRYGAVYVHFTFREDRRMARVLFAAVQDIVLQRVLEESAQQPKAWKSCSSLLSLSRIGSHMRHLGERWAG